MRVRDSKRLIIDADVAGICGNKPLPDPRSINCRNFLNVVLSLSHCVVMTEKISDEWKRHASRFARRWRVSMDARRRIDRIDPPENENLCTKIVNTARSERQRENIEKDLHLLQAALATDQTVISLDENIRRLFKQASQQVGEIQGIIWVNPDRTTEEQPITWLQNGAPPEAHRRLPAS